MFDSQRLNMRETEIYDIPFVCRLESVPDNAGFIIPWPKEKHQAALQDADMRHLIIEELETGKQAGFLIIAGLLNPHNSVELKRVIISEKNKGYGKEVLAALKNWVFTAQQAHRLWLDVKVTNERAYHVYEQQGFTKEGTLRECLRNGDAYESLHVMSLLRTEFDERQ